MKKLFLSIILSASCLLFTNKSAVAQLADGSIAPDWTLTDLDGVQWHLYDLLDEGKTVFIDIFAVWCGPCWDYHNSGALEDLYNDYGPDGTDEVRVFQIEFDGYSTADQMYGIGAGTWGDWVTGLNYPSILTTHGTAGYNAIAEYSIMYFPTTFRICPNRVIKSWVGAMTETPLYNSVGDCPIASHSVDPSIMAYTGGVSSCSDVELTITMQNMGFDDLTDCTIKAFDGATELLSYDWSGNLPLYGIEDVDLGSIVPSSSDENIDIQITSADDDVTNNSVSTEITYDDDVTMTIHVELKTDAYPTQTHWEIIDESTGIQIYEDGPYTNSQKNEIVFDEDVTLPAVGCYTFNVYDTGGDGLTGTSYCKVYDADGHLLYNGTENIDYLGTDGLKVTNETAIENSDLISMYSINPNPANNDFEFNFNLISATDVNISVVDLLGNEIKNISSGTLASGAHSYFVDVTNFASGIYFVKLEGNGINQAVKFSVAH